MITEEILPLNPTLYLETGISIQSSKWQIAYDTKFLKLGFQERAKQLNKDLVNRKIEQIRIPNKQTDNYSHWDEWKIVKVGQPPLFSTYFGPCIAVLMRAYKKRHSHFSYLSLNHIFARSDYFATTLVEIVKKIKKQGKVEIFITGGYKKNSQPQFDQIINYIENTKKMTPFVKIVVQDNTFAIADLGTFQLIVNGKPYHGLCGLKYVGFDTEGQPYQVIQQGSSFRGNVDSIENIIWDIDTYDFSQDSEDVYQTESITEGISHG